MNSRVFRSDTLLLLTAAIWGLAFTAQRAGMEHIGPFLYTGIRFALGALTLLPVWFFNRRGEGYRIGEPPGGHRNTKRVVPASLLAGLVLFLGVSFQQIGIVYTTAGKAGFVTGLYVILVPILGMVWKHRTGRGTWIGAGLAVGGLYLLGVTGRFEVSTGDLLVATSAVFWAFHVLLIGWLSPMVRSVKLAVVQYAACALISMSVALAFEEIDPRAIAAAAIPIVYGGVCSVGIGYTLQVVGQKDARPAHAAIIMSLEGVFAAVGGYLVLRETLGTRNLAGCLLMLAGMLVSQLGREGRGRRVDSPTRGP